MTSTEGEENDPTYSSEGDKSLSANIKAELKRHDPAASEQAATGKTRRRRSVDAPDDVSRALRTAYDVTLREQVPDDFLDLLGKLS